MAFSVGDLKSALQSITEIGTAGQTTLEAEYDDIDAWLDNIIDAVTNGNLTSIRLLPKTPGKKRGVLGTINESCSGSSQQDAPPEPTNNDEKKPSRKESKRPQAKRKQELPSDEETENENDSLSKRRKGPIKSAIPVMRINDVSVDGDIDETVKAPTEVVGNQRLTRTRVQRTTIVKETRETFVIEKVDQASPTRADGPPLLKTPSPIVDLATPEPVAKFKSPRQLTQRTILPAPVSPMDGVEVNPPPTRMTRTKTRAMAKAAQKETTPPPAEKSTGTESEQESDTASVVSAASRQGVTSFVKQKIGTPLGKTNFLSTSQAFGTPSNSNITTGLHSFITKPAPASVKKDRQEDYLLKLTQKTNEAVKKREELIKAQTEEKIKKRQEKVLKVNAAREAIEKERAEKLRQQMALEEEKQKQEAKRRKLAQQKALEAAEAAKLAKRQQEEEQRRLAEEKKREEEQKRLAEEKKREQELLRLAEERKKKEEEEYRRYAEEKRKEQEEKKRLAEKNRQLEEQRRLAEERRKEQAEAELRKKEHEKALAMKAKALLSAKPQQQQQHQSQLNETFVKPSDETFVKPSDETFAQSSSTYDMTPMPEDRKPAPSKSVDDYGIDDAGCDDSSEDESNPKKEVPLWAQGKNRMPHLMSQYYIRHRQVALFFESKRSTPDLSKIFHKIDRKMLIRKSSAVWRTPPVKFNDSIM